MSTDKSMQGDVDVDGLIAAIHALKPGRVQTNALLFHDLYPAIEQSLARRVSQKEIVESLKQFGLHLSLGGFRALLEAERKRRADGNESVRCKTCGAILPHQLDG